METSGREEEEEEEGEGERREEEEKKKKKKGEQDEEDEEMEVDTDADEGKKKEKKRNKTEEEVTEEEREERERRKREKGGMVEGAGIEMEDVTEGGESTEPETSVKRKGRRAATISSVWEEEEEEEREEEEIPPEFVGMKVQRLRRPMSKARMLARTKYQRRRREAKVEVFSGLCREILEERVMPEHEDICRALSVTHGIEEGQWTPARATIYETGNYYTVG